jgi:hypothetical protein
LSFSLYFNFSIMIFPFSFSNFSFKYNSLNSASFCFLVKIFSFSLHILSDLFAFENYLLFFA